MTKLTNRKKNTLKKQIRKVERGQRRCDAEQLRLEKIHGIDLIPDEYREKYGIII